MKNLVTKKNVFFASVFAFVFANIIIFQENVNLCTLVDGKYYRDCLFSRWTQNSIAVPLLGISCAALLVSLITRKLRDEVFYTWLKFSAFAIPVMLFCIFKSPESAYGGALASAMTVTRAQAALQLSVIYLIISLILITYKHFTLKRNRTGK